MNAHHEAAARLEQEAIDSFDRCDTDGFVSQFCSGLSGRLERVRGDIQDAGGKSEFWGLYQGDRRVKAKMGRGQYGSYWLLHEDETALIAARGKVFLPTGTRSRVLNQLGLCERKEIAPAWADFGGEGTGLGSLLNVRIDVFRTGCKWGTDAKLI